MRLFRPEPAFRSGFSLSPDDRPSPRPSGGHCSRPASSTPQEDRPQVRSARDSSLAPVCPGVGDLNAAARCPEFNPSIPVSPRSSASPSGCRPLRIAAFDPIWCRGSSPSETPRSPAAPRNSYFCCGSWLWVRCCFGGWPFLKPLGTTTIFLPARI